MLPQFSWLTIVSILVIRLNIVLDYALFLYVLSKAFSNSELIMFKLPGAV